MLFSHEMNCYMRHCIFGNSSKVSSALDNNLFFFGAGFTRSGKVKKKYSFKGSQEKSVKVMKIGEILLKLEESQGKVRNFCQLMSSVVPCC